MGERKWRQCRRCDHYSVDDWREELLYVLRMNDEITSLPGPLSAGMDRIELMQTFVRIVEAGSLSAAAAQLGTTQPTVSRRLQLLERSLGVRLLQRSTHSMRLTEDGVRCFAGAKELLANWAAFESGLKGVREEPEGLLRVVVPHAFGQQMLVGPLADFLNEHDKVAVEWLLHDRQPDFIAEGIDCAIHVGEVRDPNLVAIKLAEVPRTVVAAPALIGAGLTVEAPERLAELPWLAMRTFYRNDIVLTHRQSGDTCHLRFQPRLSTDSLYAIRTAAVLGLGVCVGSSWLFTDEIEQGRLVHLVPGWYAKPLPMYLVYPYASFYPARLRRFVDAMREVVPGLIG